MISSSRAVVIRINQKVDKLKFAIMLKNTFLGIIYVDFDLFEQKALLVKFKINQIFENADQAEKAQLFLNNFRGLSDMSSIIIK